MLFRAKITKCLDIVIESNELSEVIELMEDFLKTCVYPEKVYIHVLDRKDNELVDKGIVYFKESMED